MKTRQLKTGQFAFIPDDLGEAIMLQEAFARAVISAKAEKNQYFTQKWQQFLDQAQEVVVKMASGLNLSPSGKGGGKRGPQGIDGGA